MVPMLVLVFSGLDLFFLLWGTCFSTTWPFWVLAFGGSRFLHQSLCLSWWSFLHTGGDSWLPWQLPAAEGSFPGWLAPSLCKLDLSPNNWRPQLINQASQAEVCPLARTDATSGGAVTFDQDISHVQPKFYLTASHFATSATFLGQRTHLLNYVARKYFPSDLAQTSWHIPCMVLEVRVRGSHRHDCLLIRFFDISVIKFPLMEFRPTHVTARVMPSVLSPEASLRFCSTQISFFFSNDATSASEWNTFQTGPEKAMSV